MPKSPHVFIVNKGMHDYSQASNFGDGVITLTSGHYSRVNVTQMVREMTPQIDESSPEDWILISGPSVANCIACVLFAQKHNRLNLLIHASRENIYVQRTLKF